MRMSLVLGVAIGLTAALFSNYAFAGKCAGGLIGGEVGRFCENHMNPVDTPMPRQGVEQGGRAAGTYLEGKVGGENSAYGGRTINERAAGQSRFVDPARSQQHQQEEYYVARQNGETHRGGYDAPPRPKYKRPVYARPPAPVHL